MDDSVHGMHLALDLLDPSPTKEGKIASTLAVVNYSCNGYNLRMQLLPLRKWRVTNELVFELEPPS